MLQIEIDGKKVSVEQGSNIIEAAHRVGTYIPHFCYHKKLSIAASCRMCLVEVEKAPKPLPACATPVTDGMVVKTSSEKARNAQQGVMEFLLINHPLDCPVCDQGGECLLQDLAVGYGRGESHFREEKRAVVAKDMGPLVSAAEMSRCIQCTRCVRFTEEIAGYQEIGSAFRGEHSEIMPFLGKVIESELSGNVIDLCPVGALTSKPFRYQARTWELSRRKSIAAHDSLGSNIIVQTKGHRVVRVLPLENEAINECWLSDRDRFSYEGTHHHERLLKPMIKQDNRWHEVDWETAFAYVTKGLNGVSHDYGKDALGFLVNPSLTVEELFLSKKVAEKFGVKSIDSRLRQQDLRLEADRLHRVYWLGQSIEDLLASEAVLVIGSELRSEQPLLAARLRRAAHNGMKLSVLHTRKEMLHMPLFAQEVCRPQDWVAHIQAMLKEGAEDAIVQQLKNAGKSTIILGAAAQQHPQFADIYALAQQLAQETQSVFGILPVAANSVAADFLNVCPREAGGSHYAQMIQQPKKAMVLVGVDPAADTPDAAEAIAALQEAETVIAMSSFTSDALLEAADVILPMVPVTETSGSLINMEGTLQSFYGVARPLGEARPLWKILRVLGNRLNLEGFDYRSSEEVLAEAIPEGRIGAYLDNLTAHQVKTAVETPVAGLWRVGGVGLYDTDAVVRRADSLQKTTQAAASDARIHPATLAKMDLVDGQQVKVREVALTVRADDTLAEDVVYLPTHPAYRYVGAMMSRIELTKGA